MLLLFSAEAGSAPDTDAPVVTPAPAAGAYPPGTLVTLSANKPATIYFTLDGSDPTTASAVYAAPFAPGAATVKYFAVDAADNASAIESAVYSIALIVPTDPPEGWKNSTTPAAPGPSGAWGSVVAPSLPAVVESTPIYALTSYSITLNLQTITGLVERCTVEESENAAFATCTLELPVGVDIAEGDAVAVIIAGVSRLYLVADITSSGPVRSVWCRSVSSVLDEPHAAEGSWNGWDTPHATAAALAATLCGSVAIDWQLPDWTLPPRWELTGTPIVALQTLVASVGGIIQPNPDGSLTARRRWPIRPPDMAAATPVATVSRDTALDETPITAKDTPGKGYGSVTVYGYDPAADLPDMETEEKSPALGSPVHVRLFWPYSTRPPFNPFITDGAASNLGTFDYLITAEEVTFENGAASTRYPIKALHTCSWIGADQGAVWWLQNGSSKELSTIQPGRRGLAEVTYTTSYDRWQLTGQTVAKCLFGVDVGQGQVSALVSYSSGGSVAPAQTAPLINDTAGCIEAGTAYLDNSRAFTTVNALLPLTTAPIVPGATVLIDDPVTGVVGNGKVVSATITLEPDKTTRKVEVLVPC